MRMGIIYIAQSGHGAVHYQATGWKDSTVQKNSIPCSARQLHEFGLVFVMPRIRKCTLNIRLGYVRMVSSPVFASPRVYPRDARTAL